MVDAVCPIPKASIDEFTGRLRAKLPSEVEIDSFFRIRFSAQSPYAGLPDTPIMMCMTFNLSWHDEQGRWIEFPFDILEWKMKEITDQELNDEIVQPVLKLI